jgi:hypothetical protein
MPQAHNFQRNPQRTPPGKSAYDDRLKRASRTAASQTGRTKAPSALRAVTGGYDCRWNAAAQRCAMLSSNSSRLKCAIPVQGGEPFLREGERIPLGFLVERHRGARH